MPANRVESGPRSLWAAAVVSVLLHLAGGLVIVAPWNQTASPAPSGAQVEPLVSVKPNVPRLGIERSNAVTVTWVGFESPTEHQAPLSQVEQAMLTPAPGLSPLASAEPAPQAPPAEVSPPTPAAQPSPRATQTQPTPPPAPGVPLEVLAPVAIAPPAPTSDRALEPTQTPSAPTEPVTPTRPEQTQPATPPTPSESASGRPGLQDPRESDAAALKRPLEYKPGKPIAGEGIEITTVRPNFGTTVRMLANPDNPLVVIDFGPDGRVRHARFARNATRTLNTGNPYVDGAILDAIYRWKARGKAIDELGEDQMLTYSVRLLLRG
ncbi:MAG: hypothetical protein KJZ65_09355 [Phycisphaerales bacterium]|nr:hypothetical protein [Phycisphaerales bacterium]